MQGNLRGSSFIRLLLDDNPRLISAKVKWQVLHTATLVSEDTWQRGEERVRTTASRKHNFLAESAYPAGVDCSCIKNVKATNRDSPVHTGRCRNDHAERSIVIYG